jgi:hypothetical protein
VPGAELTRPVVLNFPAASAVIAGFYGCVLWHSSVESTGSASAEYSLWDGSNTSGPLLMDITLTASQSTRDYIHKHHLPFRSGLYFDLVSGAVRGSMAVLAGCGCSIHGIHVEYEPTIIQVGSSGLQPGGV